MDDNKRFIMLMLLISLFITSTFGIYIQKSWVSAKASTKKYYVKEKYMRDLGKNFKAFKKKYGWTLTNGEYTYAALCDYQIPGKKIWYTFQGAASGSELWEMKNNSKCMTIRMNAKALVKGFKGRIKISKFVSKLNSSRKASWSISAPRGALTARITFYAKNGQEYVLSIDINTEKDQWISADDWVDLVKVYQGGR